MSENIVITPEAMQYLLLGSGIVAVIGGLIFAGWLSTRDRANFDAGVQHQQGWNNVTGRGNS